MGTEREHSKQKPQNRKKPCGIWGPKERSVQIPGVEKARKIAPQKTLRRERATGLGVGWVQKKNLSVFQEQQATTEEFKVRGTEVKFHLLNHFSPPTQSFPTHVYTYKPDHITSAREQLGVMLLHQAGSLLRAETMSLLYL